MLVAPAGASSENDADDDDDDEEEEARAPWSRLLVWTLKLGNFVRALIEIFVKKDCSEQDSGRRGISMQP